MSNVSLPKEHDDGRLQGWVQSDKEAHRAMWKLGVKHPMALAVLHFLVSRVNRGAQGVVISAGALSRAMGIAPRTVQNTIGVLKDCKFVQVLKSGNTNVYIVNARIAWQGNRGNRYAAFNAAIQVDEGEQTQSVDELIAEGEEMIQIPVMHFSEPLLEDALEMDAPEKPARPVTVKRRGAKPRQQSLLDDA